MRNGKSNSVEGLREQRHLDPFHVDMWRMGFKTYGHNGSIELIYSLLARFLRYSHYNMN